MRKPALVAATAVALWALSVPGAASRASADPASKAWDCIEDQSGVVGHWEVQIDGEFSEFVYSRDLYPGNPFTRVALTHVQISQNKRVIALASHEVEIAIHLGGKPAGICPVYGESCQPATLARLSVPGIGQLTSNELTGASWACSPKSDLPE